MELKTNRRSFLIVTALASAGWALARKTRNPSVAIASSQPLAPRCFFGETAPVPPVRPRTQTLHYHLIE